MKLQDTAFIAAIVTTVWNSVQLYRLRRRLRIEAGIVPILGVWDKKQMLITVSNMAIRPITVLDVWGFKNWLEAKKSMRTCEIKVLPKGWPVTLREGDRVCAVIDRYENLCSGTYGYICVRDSVGKRWRIKRKLRLNLIKQAADHRPFPAPDCIIEERGDGTRITHITKQDV